MKLHYVHSKDTYFVTARFSQHCFKSRTSVKASKNCFNLSYLELL